jgi:hypothetical protein
MTREAARQLERQLRKRYLAGSVDVSRVFGGVRVAVSDERGRLFIRVTDDSPLLALLGADLDTEHADLQGHALYSVPLARSPRSRNSS